MKLWCCGCGEDIEPRLTDGAEIYPHRPDLSGLPFWRCDACNNFVGCHHKTPNRTKPLGCIPTPEIKKARQHIHRVLDPIWKQKKIPREKLYCEIAAKLGVKEYHTAEIRSVDDAREVYRVVSKISQDCQGED